MPWPFAQSEVQCIVYRPTVNMGSQQDAQKMHIKDFEEEFDDKSIFEICPQLLQSSFSTVHMYS